MAAHHFIILVVLLASVYFALRAYRAESKKQAKKETFESPAVRKTSQPGCEIVRYMETPKKTCCIRPYPIPELHNRVCPSCT